MAADVVGYTRLMREDEAGTLATLNAHRNAIDPLILSHGGRIVKTTGDGLLVEFPSVVEAVQSASEIQRTMSERNAVLPDDRRMVFRIGINLGDVIVEADDIHGDGVNVASRLEGLAEPGGICVSGLVQQSARHAVDMTFLPIGPQQVKNIAEPIEAWRIDMRGTEALALAAAAETVRSERAAIAVLPFKNLSGDPEQEYFADGLTEDVISALSNQRGLRVLARNSTFNFKEQSIDVRQVARALDARYVLEGSVRKAGARVRVSASLIDSTTELQAWTERFDRDLEDIFEVQDEITTKIVGQIAPELLQMEGLRARSRPPESLNAWDLYLQALWHSNQPTRADLEEGEALIRRAIEIDSTFSQFHRLLALILGRALLVGRWKSGSALWDEATSEAELAVRLDDRNAEAHSVLASIYGFSGRHDPAVAAGRKAVELGPAIANCHFHLGIALWQAGEQEAASKHLIRADSLNPHAQDRYSRATILAYVFYLMGRYDAALAWAERAEIASAKLQIQIWGVKAAALAQLKRNEEALSALARFKQYFPDQTITDFRRRLRWRKPEDIDHYMDGLRKAGLPER